MPKVKVTQASFAAGELSPSLHARHDLAKYMVGLKSCRNFMVLPHGPVAKTPGTYIVAEAKVKDKAGRLIPFQFSTVQAYALWFEHLVMRVVKDGGLVVYPDGHALAGQVVEVASPYTAGELQRLSFAQSADVLYLAHPNHPPKKLSRTDHHEWTFGNVNFTPSIAPPTGLSAVSTAGGTGKEWAYKVAAVNAAGEESSPSSAVVISGPPDDAPQKIVTVSWNAAPGAVYYKVYKRFAGLYGWAGQTSDGALSFMDDNIKPDTGVTPSVPSNPFTGPGAYPGVVSIYEQRLVLGRTDTQPQTIFMSETGNYESMAKSSPLRDDNAIELPLDSGQLNEIRHFVSLNDLIVLTSGAEWKVNSGGSGAITPFDRLARPQSYSGSSPVRPVLIGNGVLYVQDKGSIVRDLAYSWESDAYGGNDRSILAQHLFSGKSIVEWGYQQTPHSIIWACRNDGLLLGFTYLREHDVWAWHQHPMGGDVESVVVIPENGQDRLYMLIKRGGMRMCERMASMSSLERVEDAFFVRCGVTWAGYPTMTVPGLDHLEGETVVALADGNVFRGLVVVGGKISLPIHASIVHVGLAYEAVLETLNIESVGEISSVGKFKKILSTIVRVEKSREMHVSAQGGGETESSFRTDESYGEATRLFTGFAEIEIDGEFSDSATVKIRVGGPVPCTVLGITTDIEVSSK